MKMPVSVNRSNDRLLTAVGVLFLFAAFPAAAATLCGHVYDAVSGKAVGAADVRVYQADGASTGWHALTDVDGAWCIDAVPAGTYHLVVLAGGYRIGTARDVVVTDTASDVDISAQAPVTAIDAPWPNPAQGRVNFRMRLGTPGAASLGVYDVAGRRLRAWGDVDAVAGERTLDWDFRDEGGREVPAGRYYLRLEAGGIIVSQPFVRVR